MTTEETTAVALERRNDSSFWSLLIACITMIAIMVMLTRAFNHESDNNLHARLVESSDTLTATMTAYGMSADQYEYDPKGGVAVDVPQGITLDDVFRGSSICVISRNGEVVDNMSGIVRSISFDAYNRIALFVQTGYGTTESFSPADVGLSGYGSMMGYHAELRDCYLGK